ncbi:neprilysin-11-like protein, partial [Leptotrombidium deliense]
FKDDYGYEALHKFFNKIGGYPMITEKWNDANFDWQNAYVYVDTHINAIKLFIAYQVDRVSLTDKTHFIIVGPQPGFHIGSTLISELYSNEDKMEAEIKFRKKVKKLLSGIGGDKLSDELIERDINALIEFEKKFASIEQQSEAADTGENFVLSIEEMQNQYKDTELGDQSIKEVNGFLRTIKDSLTLTINTNKWMDEETKQNAQLKLNRMLSYIASPSQVKNDEELDEFYKHLSFQLEILIGILLKPHFYLGAPLAINMAAIGSAVGHEITHGFDNTGSQYDEQGLKQNWWDKQTQRHYGTKVNCFIRQYSNYVEPKTGKHVDGNLTVGENIADNGGLHNAFNAYKIYGALKHPETDLKLPNQMSRFTKDQLFFIAYGNAFCSDNSKAYTNLALTDVHSPDDARVMLPLQNSKEFSKAFNCKQGSRMNPVNKCILW